MEGDGSGDDFVISIFRANASFIDRLTPRLTYHMPAFTNVW